MFMDDLNDISSSRRKQVHARNDIFLSSITWKTLYKHVIYSICAVR